MVTGFLHALFAVLFAFGEGSPRPPEKPFQRLDYLIESLPEMHLTGIYEPVDEERKAVRIHCLFSTEAGFLFLETMELDPAGGHRYISLTGGDKGDLIEWRMGSAAKALTEDQQAGRFGILSIGGRELRLTREDGPRVTVQLRIQPLFEAWPAEKRRALETIHDALSACSLSLARGDLLRLLFPNAENGPRTCPWRFTRVPSDPDRDKRFTLLDPGLSKVLLHEMLDAPEH
ncbi:MAG: hypothetical protein ACRD1B_11615 [Thermoanaerobaculia bacterium]